MGLGFGKKTPDEYKSLKSISDDLLPPAEYVVQLDGWQHLEPKGDKPGSYILRLKTTEENELKGKRVSMWFRYHPNPASVSGKDYEQMNSSTEAAMKDWIEAAGADPLVVDGALDLVKTLEVLATQSRPRVIVPATQDTYDGKTRNEFGKPRKLA